MHTGAESLSRIVEVSITPCASSVANTSDSGRVQAFPHRPRCSRILRTFAMYLKPTSRSSMIHESPAVAAI